VSTRVAINLQHITEDKSHGLDGVLESALPRLKSAAGAGVWSLAFLDVARVVTWSWSRDSVTKRL
jgi:hypothetical protein